LKNHQSKDEELIMKRNLRLPALVGAVVFAALLTSFVPGTSRPAQAQVRFSIQTGGGYYNPYGQGPYGGYGQSYGRGYDQRYAARAYADQAGRYGREAYAYPGYTNYNNSPYRNRYSAGYRSAPYVRYYGRSSYYQPSYGPVYAPYGR